MTIDDVVDSAHNWAEILYAQQINSTTDEEVEKAKSELISSILSLLEEEREACAKTCEETETHSDRNGGDICAYAIRNRSN